MFVAGRDIVRGPLFCFGETLMTSVIYDLIEAHADDQLAIGMPASEAGGRAPMTYGDLKALIQTVQH